MIRSSLFLLLMIIHLPGFSQKKDIDELTKLNQDWIDLSIRKDTAAFAKIFADDFVLISPGGAKRTKWEVVRNLLSQDIKSTIIDSLDIRLLTHETGIITCYTSFVLINDGKEIPGKVCYQDVYIKRRGRWLAISAHVTLLGTN